MLVHVFVRTRQKERYESLAAYISFYVISLVGGNDDINMTLIWRAPLKK